MIKKLTKYKEKQSTELFEEIAKDFEPLILSLYQKAKHENLRTNKDDLRQELLLTLFQVLNTFEIETDLDSQLFTTKNKYYVQFINSNKQDDIDLIKQDFIAFYNENQFKNYLTKAMTHATIKYLKKLSKCNEISLNTKINDKIELLETIGENVNELYNKYDLSKLSNKEIEFLNQFIEKDRILNNSEVARKLKITRQAVHKQKQKIIKKVNL